MKRIMSVMIKPLLVILIGGAFATSVQAQSAHAMTVSIPFQFTVGTRSIAPGTYRFNLEPDSFELSIINTKNGHAELFAVLPEQERTLRPLGHLVFEKREDDRVLNEVHFSGTDMFIEVVQPHGARRVMAKRSLPSDSVSVAQR
ncbi:hypothetical protein GCM10011507_13540 [Edaphobacter acidisoli]|uniref:Uncharacterized protein n=1 Tax=Edaphobacter acidisoli TaxID=2040573 RepID=A0A916RP20_9BACT|nr:hypothetical protein [Edaphobacter acidisoli]GGA63197.1 hypothetical protein GCM10011507_13540 [Edaphobacter acidisoli]